MHGHDAGRSNVSERCLGKNPRGMTEACSVSSSLRTGEVITVCCQVSPVAGRGATIETRRGFQPTVIDWTESSSSRSDD
jgi:hypothetical protein